MVQAVDLSVSATDTGLGLLAGAAARLDITVTNEQPSIPAPNPVVFVTVEDADLDTSVAFPANCERLPVPDGAAASVASDLLLRCVVNSVGLASSTATLRVQVLTMSNATELTSRVEVKGRAPDPVADNNVWTNTAVLQRRFDLSARLDQTALPLGSDAFLCAFLCVSLASLTVTMTT